MILKNIGKWLGETLLDEIVVVLCNITKLFLTCARTGYYLLWQNNTPSVPPICLQIGCARRLRKMYKVVGKRNK